MASLNKVTLIGRLGRDPEIITFENGGHKANMTLATTDSYRDRDNNWIESTEWHNMVVYGMLANDIFEKRRNYNKGDLMYVEGRIKTRQYVDKDNITRSITEIIVDRMMQLAPAQARSMSSATAGTQSVPNSAYNQETAPARPDPFSNQLSDINISPIGDDSDDLPF